MTFITCHLNSPYTSETRYYLEFCVITIAKALPCKTFIQKLHILFVFDKYQLRLTGR